MWLLSRRLKFTNNESDIILDHYIKEIGIVADHGVGVATWNSGLTVSQVCIT